MRTFWLKRTQDSSAHFFTDVVYNREPENNSSPEMVYFSDPTVQKRINVDISLQGYKLAISR